MGLQLSNKELDAMDGLPHFHRCLYIFGIRRYMDFKTGIVGTGKKEISYKSLAEEVYVKPHVGVENTGSNSRDQVKRALLVLEKKGLIKRKSIVTKNNKQLILSCPLADTDESAQNKAAPNPPWAANKKDAPQAALVNNSKNHLKTDTKEDIEEKSRPTSRPENTGAALEAKIEKPPDIRISVGSDQTRSDMRQVFLDLLSQRRFPLAYLADAKTHAMLEAWEFAGITADEASRAMQHADAKAIARQERVNKPWYYQDIPLQLRAAVEAAKTQTQEIINNDRLPTTNPKSRFTHDQRRARMDKWADEKERELAKEGSEGDYLAF